jgi:hypothetical protein
MGIDAIVPAEQAVRLDGIDSGTLAHHRDALRPG